MIVLTTCGHLKRPHPAPARDLYTGRYAHACLAYALELAPPSRVYIISAEHGLVDLDQVLTPYSQRLGWPGSVHPDYLEWQARGRGLLGEQAVAVGGRDYVQLCRAVWPSCAAPLQELAVRRGIGTQLAWLTSETQRLRADREVAA